MLIDYSKNLINAEIMTMLFSLVSSLSCTLLFKSGSCEYYKKNLMCLTTLMASWVKVLYKDAGSVQRDGFVFLLIDLVTGLGHKSSGLLLYSVLVILY